ncbi:CHAT domain-containing protein [Streptomyces endophytica]|uniref:CHAT domain-containing protein n=1 Tax=Streptomyces endophytica TaxID=2991496 RepID=A0ABY6PJY8_9ACTN|nr:CHAT domain-containing protein [Streptomyces endophytica]UZJ33462.1 CHAT domain-containing protein [Streptomyces endophytica]
MIAATKNNAENSQVLELVADSLAELRVVAGHCGTASLGRMLQLTHWWLHPDGRLLVIPEPGLARRDLFPLRGRHAPCPGGVRLRAEYRHRDGPYAGITGEVLLNPDGTGARELDAQYRVTAASGTIEVALRQRLVPATHQTSGRRFSDATDSLNLPALYRVWMAGQAAGHSFGPVEGEVVTLPAVADAPWPVELLISTNDLASLGALSWIVSAPGLSRTDTGELRMFLQNGLLHCQSTAPEGAPSICWNAPMPIPATNAEALLRCTGATVHGRIAATGRLFGHEAAYEARVEGEAIASGPPDPADFERWWRERTVAADQPSAAETALLEAPGASAPPGAPSVPNEAQPWRTLRDQGFDLTLAGRHLQAVTVLRQALAGCQAERHHATGHPADSLLIDEVNILTRLLHCHRSSDELAPVLETLHAAVTVRRELARRHHLAQVIREQAHGAMTALTDVLEDWRLRLDTEVARIDLLTHADDFFVSLTESIADLGLDRTALAAAERGRGRVFLDVQAARRNNAHELGAVEALSAEELLAQIHMSDATVLEYAVGSNTSRAWLVTPDGQLDSVRLPSGALTLLPLVERARTLLESARPDQAQMSTVLTRLHTLLIAPLPHNWLPTTSPAPNPPPLIVIPHRMLFHIPFAALRDAETGQYLLDRCALSYAPSIGTLRYARARPRPIQRRLACFVDPSPMPGGLPSLSELRANLHAITGHYLPDARTERTGRGATLARLRDDASQHDVLLLGTHAQADDDHADHSFIALAPDQTSGHDGVVRPGDLQQLDCRAELVILMACQSAGGRVTGDGVQGLARSVLLSGAASLLASQWSIPQELSLDLVYRFHEQWLANGTSKAEALRRGQAEIATLYPDQPQHWAGFQLTGAWR